MLGARPRFPVEVTKASDVVDRVETGVDEVDRRCSVLAEIWIS